MNKLFLLVFLAFLIGCKKDKDVDPVEYNIEQNFLCEVDDNYSYSSFGGTSISTDYDIVLATKIENDSLTFRGLKFPLTSFDLNSGFGSHTINLSSSSVTLTLSNEFRDLYYNASFPSASSGPATSKIIYGTASSISPTTVTNNAFDAQQGNYSLNIQEYENMNGVDTNYSGSYPVSHDAMSANIIIDGVSREFSLFHSHYSYVYTHLGSPYERITKSYFWCDDSLNYDYFSANGTGIIPFDTVMYHYDGVKQ